MLTRDRLLRAKRHSLHRDGLLVLRLTGAGWWANRISEQACAGIASKVLKQRVHTVAKATDVCMAFVELEQGGVVLVGSPRPASTRVNSLPAAAWRSPGQHDHPLTRYLTAGK